MNNSALEKHEESRKTNGISAFAFSLITKTFVDLLRESKCNYSHKILP